MRSAGFVNVSFRVFEIDEHVNRGKQTRSTLLFGFVETRPRHLPVRPLTVIAEMRWWDR